MHLLKDYSYLTKRRNIWCVVIVLFFTVFLAISNPNKILKNIEASSELAEHNNLQLQLPLQFEKNIGQFRDDVKFISRGSGYSLLIKPTETILNLKANKKDDVQIHTKLLNSSPSAQISSDNALLGKVNYLLGVNREQWLTNIPTYKDVVAREVYPGIDLRYHGEQKQLEYDFIVKPQADKDIIKMQFSGMSSLSINDEGELVLTTKNGEVKHKKPIIYQDINNERIIIDGKYALKGPNILGFEVASYNPDYALVIDPILDYSSYLGHATHDTAESIAVDDTGNSYVAGVSYSGIGRGDGNTQDVVITKISPDGANLVFTTYFGGSLYESNEDIAIDDNGNIYVVGKTMSNIDFPKVNAYQSNFAGGNFDGFIAKLSANGQELLFSSYIGGQGDDSVYGIAIGADDDFFIIGDTNSSDFPTQNPTQSQIGGSEDAFISQFSSDGASLIYSTFLGGSKSDNAYSITVDSNNSAFIVGVTRSDSDFPLLNPIQNYGGGSDIFLAQTALNPADGSTALRFSSYLGGSGYETYAYVTRDNQNNIIVAGDTYSTNFPLYQAFRTSKQGFGEGFVTKLSADDKNIIFSSYLGGDSYDRVSGVATDNYGNIYVIGDTDSTTGIVTTSSIQQQLSGNRDVFITKISENGSVLFSTYFGGQQSDLAGDIAISDNNAIYITGTTSSGDDFPLLNALQSLFGGGKSDAFIGKIIQNNPPEITSDPITEIFSGETYIYDVEATDKDDDPLTYRLSSAPEGMTIDSATGLISWESTAGPSSVDITIEVEDSSGDIATQSYTLTISVNDNNAPEITSVPVLSGVTNQQYSYDVDANDLDGDILAYSLTLSPSGMSIDSSSGLISWLPESEGTFYVSVDVTDGKAGKDTQTFNIIVSGPDITPPVITIDTPQNGLITNKAVQSISGRLNESATLLINNTPVTTTVDNKFSFAVLLAQNTNIITLKATDLLGNTAVKSITLVLDTDAPTISTLSPDDGYKTNQSSQILTGQLSEVSSLTINGNSVSVDASNGFNHPVSLLEGDNVFTLMATDTAGNTITKLISLTLDTKAPAISITSPDSGEPITLVDRPQQILKGSLNEEATLTINGQAVPLAPDNSFQFPIVLVEGENLFNLVSTDSLGNQSSMTKSLTLDTGGDIVISIISPVNNTVTNQTSHTLSGSLNIPGSLTINNENVTVESDQSFSYGIALNEGINSFILNAQNPSGAMPASKTLLITLDTIAPEIRITSPSDGVTSTQLNQTIKGYLSEAAYLTINDHVVPLNNQVSNLNMGNTTIDENQDLKVVLDRNTASYKVSGKVVMGNENNFISTLPLTYGENTFTIKATDRAGNSSTITRTVNKR